MTNFLSPSGGSAQTSSNNKLGHVISAGVLVLLLIFAIIIAREYWSRHRFVVGLTVLGDHLQEKLSSAHFWESRQPPKVTVVPTPPKPVRKITIPDLSAHRLTAKHVFIKDNASGVMLFGKAAYEPWPFASVTKLLSALVLLDIPVNLSTTTVAVNDKVFETGIMSGVEYRTGDLWQAALIASSNRALLTLVDSTGITRDDFVARMNAKALELGMTNTIVFEPTGLDPRNVGTAADSALLISEALRKPLIRETVVRKEYTFNGVDGKNMTKIHNTNWLVLGIIPSRSLILRGGKTGSIPESEYNFVFEAENERGHLIDVVVLGSQTNESRFAEGRDVALWAFDAYSWGDEGTSSTKK